MLGPENTIVAFDLGVAAGADGLELDVHLARDGRVVVIHDPTLDRTTTGHGAVADLTAADLAGVDACRRFGIDLESSWPGATAGVPTLDDVLARYRDVPLIVEMKGDRPELGPAVVAAVRTARAVTRVCLGSFSTAVLQAARDAGPEVATGASAAEGLRALQRSWLWLAAGPHPPYRAFQVPERSGRTRVVSRRFIRAVHRSGCAIQVWTVNEERDMRRLLDWGVDGLITDRPDLAVRVRDAWVAARRGGPTSPS